jgi:uncharacterized protein (DUF2164 family)
MTTKSLAGEWARLAQMFPKMEKPQKTALVLRVQEYLQREFDPEAGELASELFLEFAATLLEPLFYNEALKDARAMAARYAESLDEDLISTEKPVNAGKR